MSASSTIPLRGGRRPFGGTSSSSVEAAKSRAARARASAQVSANFRTPYHSGRSPSALKKEETKPNKPASNSLLEKQRREERKRVALEQAERRRVYPEQVSEKQERNRIIERWTQYLAQWDLVITTPSDLPEEQLLTARHLPCPMFDDSAIVFGVSGLSKAGVEAFFMHPAHSQGKSRKDRIRAALLQWHPDKFEKWTCKFRENKRKLVREAAEVIARYLTDIMRDATKT
ncbi:mitochondrial intermembrane space import and assembly protein [Ceratobasidium sp. AG-Ba]|nr:mitochondrial intermembrane space import and assembly protein [Ceratobasidium sp. AG-Ba]QRW10747.1 mitochondrial intermembrane space import and assembly protein [Ceratobasidium sp. AG-Ba]